MGLGLNLALFVGIPVAVIVTLGFVLNRFRGEILGSASALGSVFAGIFTSPVTGFLEQISTAFSDLPDIQIKIPGINIEQGLFTITQETPGTGGIVNGVTIPPGCSIGPQGQLDCPTPPTFDVCAENPELCNGGLPGAEAAGFTLFEGGSILVNFPIRPGETESRRFRLSREEIVEEFPRAIGIFDILATPETEFFPFSVEAARFIGLENIRLSGQLFEEIKNVSDIPLG